jgi:hypothetical protein
MGGEFIELWPRWPARLRGAPWDAPWRQPVEQRVLGHCDGARLAVEQGAFVGVQFRRAPTPD